MCIPWQMAGVRREGTIEREAWQLHIEYLQVLQGLIRQWNGPTVVAGDFNQRIPRGERSSIAAAQALAETFEPMTIVTAGVPKGVTRQGIDHIAVSDQLQAMSVWGWAKDVTGKRMSDHDDAGADLELL